MSDLRSKIIRLAHTNPELRKDLLPLLKKAKTAATHGDLMGKAEKGSIAEYVDVFTKKWFAKFSKDLTRARRDITITSLGISDASFELPEGIAPNYPKWAPHFKLSLRSGSLSLNRWTGSGDHEIDRIYDTVSSDKVLRIVLDALDTEVKRLIAKG